MFLQYIIEINGESNKWHFFNNNKLKCSDIYQKIKKK